MKFILILVMMVFCTNTTIELSQLSPEARNEILNLEKKVSEEKAAKQVPAPEVLQPWVRPGVELGKAIAVMCKELNVPINEFTKTPIGKITTVTIVWKVIGRDCIAFLFWLVITFLGVLLTRHMIGYKEIEFSNGNNTITTQRVRRYAGESREARASIGVVSIIVWCVLTMVVLMIIFP